MHREVTERKTMSIRTRAVTKVKVFAAGRERLLSYPLWAFMKFQEQTGEELMPLLIGTKNFIKEDVGIIIAGVWAGLLEDDPELTLDDVARTIDLPILMEVLVPAMVRAASGKTEKELQEALKKAEKAAKKDRPTRTSPTKTADSLASGLTQ